jgi:pimeloyl-ACP methyl ester carboxylesterase
MRTVKAGEFQVEYADTGTGPAVILLHSSASGLRQWKRLADALTGSYRVIAVNLFGYGATSRWPAGRVQTLADQAGLVHAVALQHDEPVALIGHSLGGAVALEAARGLAGALRSVIVFEPILFSLLDRHGPPDARAEIHDLAARYDALGREGDWDRAGETFVDYWSGPGTWAAMPDDRKAGLRTMLPNVLQEWHAVLAPSRTLDQWQDIAAPVHVLRAADTRRPTHAIAALLTGTDAQWPLHEIAAGGHMAPLTRPDLVNPKIASLLATVTP